MVSVNLEKISATQKSQIQRRSWCSPSGRNGFDVRWYQHKESYGQWIDGFRLSDGKRQPTEPGHQQLAE